MILAILDTAMGESDAEAIASHDRNILSGALIIDKDAELINIVEGLFSFVMNPARDAEKSNSRVTWERFVMVWWVEVQDEAADFVSDFAGKLRECS
jgi:hypothetical protein